MKRFNADESSNIANIRGGAIAGAAVLVQQWPAASTATVITTNTSSSLQVSTSTSTTTSFTTATIYSTNVISTANVKSNPMTSGSDGGFWFYAPDGHYQLTVTPPGGVPVVMPDVVIDGAAYGVEGDRANVSNDQSVLRTGTYKGTSGDLYTLLGSSALSVAMVYETHNFPISSTGMFGPRDEAGDGWLKISTEGSQERYYYVASGAIGVSPVQADFTLQCTFNYATGALTLVAPQSTMTVGLASTATSVKGTTTNDNAAAGNVGEFFQPMTSTAIAMGSGTSVNVTTATLLAGDYDADGIGDFIPAATTSLTRISVGLSTTSAALGGQDTYSSIVFGAFAPGTNLMNIQAPYQRIQVSSAQGTATVWLVASAVFTTSTLGTYGSMNIRRAR